MRRSTLMRPGLLNELVLNVTERSRKRWGEAADAKLWQTSRSAGSVWRSTWRRKAVRQFSVSQKLRKVALPDRTRLQTDEAAQLASRN
jgi:hypothetical protein